MTNLRTRHVATIAVGVTCGVLALQACGGGGGNAESDGPDSGALDAGIGGSAGMAGADSGADAGDATLPPLGPTTERITFQDTQDDLAPLEHTPSFEPDYNRLTPQPWVRPVTTQQQDTVDVTPETLEFPGSMTDVGTWEPGRLVVGAPSQGTGRNPMGFARRVVSVENVGGRWIVTTKAVALEDVLQGEFQLELDPDQMEEMDLSKADLQWVADNLYYRGRYAQLMEGDLLVDDYPVGDMPLGFFKNVGRFLKRTVGGAARAIGMAARDAYLDITPETVMGSVKLDKDISIERNDELFDGMNYNKPFNTKRGTNVTLNVQGTGNYEARLRFQPGVQIGAELAFPGHQADSRFWLNIDSALEARFALDVDFEAKITAAAGRSGTALLSELGRGGELAKDVLGASKQQFMGDPDMKPGASWKKTLWISKPATQTFAVGPIPVVITETLQVDLECTLEAKATIKADVLIERNAYYKFSAEFSSATGKTVTGPDFRREKKFEVNVSGGGKIEASCGLVPRINAFLYDSIGMFAGVRGSLIARAEYKEECKEDPVDFRPNGELTFGLYGGVGVRIGIRAQVPGASFVGKKGADLGIETSFEPWNKEWPLYETAFDIPSGIGYCTPTCQNGAMDEGETDVDCGGENCGKCPLGNVCERNTDCTPAVCNGGRCSNNRCGDGVLDADETDVDCGGSGCEPCGNGLECNVPTDCQSGYCSEDTADPDGATSVCTDSHCNNGALDGDEGGIDCGGNLCDKCADGVEVSNPLDCESGIWNGTMCVPSTCDDLILSGDETGPDCGGPTCAGRCDFQQGCNETSDCAEAGTRLLCSPTRNVCSLAPGVECSTGVQCVTGVCTGGFCDAGSGLCANGMQDGAETDIDCGGGECPKCDTGQRCALDRDCDLGECTLGIVLPSGGACTIPSTLLGAWELDDDGADRSGNGRIADTTGITFTTQALSGSHAADLNGSQLMTVGPLDVGNEFTLAAWVYAPAPTNGFPNGILANAGPGPDAGFKLYFNNVGGDLALAFGSADGIGAECTYATAANVIQLDTWHHVAAVVDRLAGTVTLFVDGSPVAGTGCVSTGFTTDRDLLLGSLVQGAGLLGRLDDVRVYGARLVNNDIQALATP